jgi:hypothetical protein
VYDPAMDDGFTTRAIRAATRVPRVDQPPSSVPIYCLTVGLLALVRFA